MKSSKYGVFLLKTSLPPLHLCCVEATRDDELGRVPADHVPASLRLTGHPVRYLLISQNSVPEVDVRKSSVAGVLHEQDIFRIILLRLILLCMLNTLMLKDDFAIEVDCDKAIILCDAETVPNASNPSQFES